VEDLPAGAFENVDDCLEMRARSVRSLEGPQDLRRSRSRDECRGGIANAVDVQDQMAVAQLFADVLALHQDVTVLVS
jgi:hypothetical protein